MARLLRPTLGPLPRTVAIDRITSTSRGPEILDSGAAIARRTIQLADPFENMGAMLLRHVAWRVFERAGDGTTTAAVLAQSLMHAGVRYIAAGGNPVFVGRGMQRGLRRERLTAPWRLPASLPATSAQVEWIWRRCSARW
ncbi:MAG: hypothetical protein E6I52_25850 [Chloroflexi bacterium]|nr:MAG: hypothetical protein E6I52_25850 [Chloroflexota bacterium]